MIKLELKTKDEHGAPMYALIDDEDFERVKGYEWSWHSTGKGTFDVRAIYATSRTKSGFSSIRLARFIMNATGRAIYVSMRDHNQLNCQKANLHMARGILGLATRRNKTGAVGVSTRNGRWRASIGVNRQMFRLGTFDRLEDAKVAYDLALEAIKAGIPIQDHLTVMRSMTDAVRRPSRSLEDLAACDRGVAAVSL